MTPTDIVEGTYVLPKEKHDPVPTEPHPVEAKYDKRTTFVNPQYIYVNCFKQCLHYITLYCKLKYVNMNC